MLRHLFSRSKGSEKRGDPYIAFLGNVDEPMEIRPSTAMQTPLASFRLRTLIPSRQLSNSIRIWVLPLRNVMVDPLLARHGEPIAAVITKLPSSLIARRGINVKELFDWMAQWRRGKRRLVADVSDNYASTGHPLLMEFQSTLLREAELVVPCEALREELQEKASHPVTVIEDPYERESAAAVRAAMSDPVKLCWFGQFDGPTREQVAKAMLELGASLRGRPAILTLVSGPRQLPVIKDFARSMAETNPAFAVQFIGWSVAATWSAIEQSDFVLLPQDTASAWGRVKSHNRMVEAIRCGRLPLASPIPSYLELDDYACIRPTLSEAFDWAVSHVEEAEQRVRAGQKYIESRFSPQVIAEKWSNFFRIP